MVAGRLEQRSWGTQEGNRRSREKVVADEIGPSAALGHRAESQNKRRGPGGGGGNNGGGRGRSAGQPQPAPDAGPGYGFDEEPF